jgi:hypothetical protein
MDLGERSWNKAAILCIGLWRWAGSNRGDRIQKWYRENGGSFLKKIGFGCGNSTSGTTHGLCGVVLWILAPRCILQAARCSTKGWPSTNATIRSATQVIDFLQEFGIQLLQNSLYNPDLASSDYSCFQKLKNTCGESDLVTHTRRLWRWMGLLLGLPREKLSGDSDDRY